ncbi:MAG: energy transducer TonB [Hyalangium sp.]|uniref:energy transducer TonB n=1 Tax=Hyalangium sp. TaxID=2028555 RepID=UPI00389A9DAD
MFQSVIEQQPWRSRRFGTGAGVSLVVHAGIFAAVLVLSSGVAKPPEPDHPLVQFMQAPPRGNPNPPVQKAAAQPPKPKDHKPKTPKTLVAPTNIPPPKPLDETPPKPPEDPDEELPYIPNSDPNSPVTAAACASCTALTNLPPMPAEPTGEETLPFSMGTMTPPKLVSGAPLQYTREALEAQVHGLLIAKCVITREGDVENCRIIKGLPHMEEAVLSALKTRHYTPVTYQGRPISVSYIFNVQLELPR